MATNAALAKLNGKALTKAMNKSWDSGAVEGFTELFQGMERVAPLQAPFKEVFAQIQVGTVKETIALMNTLFSVLKDPAAQAAIRALINLINVLLSSIGAILQFTSTLASEAVTGSPDYDHPADVGFEESAFGGGDPSIYDQPWWEAMGYTSEEEALGDLT